VTLVILNVNTQFVFKKFVSFYTVPVSDSRAGGSAYIFKAWPESAITQKS
jgi:hypothetical protein